jgi:hypothetical protein
VSDRQGWVGRLGGRATSTSQRPSSRPEPGSGGPARSNGPDPTPLPGRGPRARQPILGPEGPALRVVLVSRDNMLAGALRSLVEAPGGVRMLDWYSEDLDSVIRHADVVIVDMPPTLHERTFAVLAGRFLGRTVVLLQEGEHAEALPAGPPRALLYRPLQIGELWSAVTGGSEAVVPAEATEPEVAVVEPPGPRPDPDVPEAGGATASEPDQEPSPGTELQPDPEVAAGDPADDAAAAVEVEGPGLPVAESGRLIGLSGHELDPVVGPGQVAPGMDEATFERLRGWKSGPGARQPAGSRRTAAREESLQAEAAQAEARRIAREERQARAEEARQAKAARSQERAAARAESRQARAARAEERRTARADSRQAAAAEAEARRATRDATRRAEAAAAEERRAARAEARQAKAAEAEARRAEQAEARRVAREESIQAKTARAEARRAAHEEAVQARAARKAASRQARSARAEARGAARTEAKEKRAAEDKVRRDRALQAQAAGAEARKVARQAAQQRAARTAARKAARDESHQAKAARAEERRAASATAAKVRAVQAEARKAARAEAAAKRAAEAQVRRQQTQQEKAAKAEARAAARAEAGQAEAARAEARKAARVEARQAKAAQAEARAATRAESAKERAARAAAQQVARQEAEQARAAQARELRAAKAAREQEQQAAKAEAGRKQAAEAEARREQTQQAKAAKAEARAEAREADRAAAGRERAARAQARAAARRAKAGGIEAGSGGVSGAGAGGVGAGGRVGDRVAGVVRPAVVGLLVAVLGVAAAGWVGGGGAETRAGEVAVVRAAGGSGGGLVVQDPRVGPVAPLHALGVGVWLRASEARSSLVGVIREARVPSRFLLGGVVGLTVVLFLLLMRVGPGSGAAAGPGPAPPQQGWRRWRLGGAALAGALVALDPLLVESGRAATATILAVLLAVGTVALAWTVPARPALRWLPLVAAGGGLALLVSPLALPVLAVPVVAQLLQRRYQDAWKDMAALGLAIALWLLLPVWVAGQGLDAGQAGWLLGRPPGRGSVAASISDAPLTWLLLAAGVTAAVLTWRHRSGARSGDGLGAARLLAWMATSAAGALVAIAVGYPAEQALPFAVPAAAVSVAVGAALLVAAAGNAEGRRVAGGVRGTAGVVPRSIGGWVGAGVGVVLVGLLAAQAVDWDGRYGRAADDGLGRLVATVGAEVPACSAVNASGPDDRARLLAAGVTVTDFSDGPAAHAAGVRYFVLTGGTGRGGPISPSLAAWVRQHGTRLAAHPSRSLSGVELWRVDAAPLDPVADLIPLPDGVFSNTSGSACGGYRVVDSQAGSFHTAYRSVGGKAVLGRPLGSVWTSDGPALQAFDTMVLGAVPTASGPPAVRPIELPPLLAKLNVEAVADADIPLPSATPPVTNRQVRALLHDKLIGRAYLGTDPATASAEDFRRARERFGRPLGLPQTMPDGAIRQPFERAVLELPADGGPVRPAALGRLAVRLGLVPRQAMRLEPVPGLPARPAETRLDPAPLLRLVGGALVLLLLAAAAGTVLAWRSRTARTG